MTIFIIILAVVVAFFVYTSYISRRGFKIAECDHQFELIYDDIAKSGSKQKAIEEASVVFKDCPFINVISESEWREIAGTLGKAKNPKEVLRVITIALPSDRMVTALRDTATLKKLIDLSDKGAITDPSEWGKRKASPAPTEKPSANAKRCPNCKMAVEDDAVFCGSCSTKLPLLDAITRPEIKPETLKDATRDKTWERHLLIGQKLEEFTIGEYTYVFLEIDLEETSVIRYRYRLLIFPVGQNKPVLSLNLEENTTAGTCCFGAHLKDGHENLGLADKKMSFQDFKQWAVETAKKYLDAAGNDPVDELKPGDMDKLMETPPGPTLSMIFELSRDTEKLLTAQIPAVKQFQNIRGFGRFIQVATLAATLLRIERHFGDKDYTALHKNILQSIDPTIREQDIELLNDLIRILYKFARMPAAISAGDAIPPLNKLLVLEEGQLSTTIGYWVVGSLKGADPDESDEKFVNALGVLLYKTNAKAAYSMFLETNKSLA